MSPSAARSPTCSTVAVVQLCATNDVDRNLDQAEALCRTAAEQGADAIFLPEAFAFLGSPAEKQALLEPLPEGGPILHRCGKLARELGSDLVLGGFHEQHPADSRSLNTCIHLDRQGEVRALYRKIHLFDVQLDDGTELNESQRTAPGDTLVTTDLAFGRLGLSVCYDLRFPALYQALVDQGAIALTVPSAFTSTTGPAHWHVLLRARAIECQSYVIAPAQHGDHGLGRRSYGHSVIIDPWGEVIAEVEQGDGVALAQIDPQRVASVRRQLPSLEHRRSLRSDPPS